MRVLTVMSVIFMPLTFVAGVYGMNFDAPEFHWRYGYAGVWLLIVAVFVGVLVWFRRSGWLR
jgi:magnesium transporter